MRDGVHDTDYSYPRVCLLQHLFGACDANCNAPTAPVFMPPAPRRLTPQVRLPACWRAVGASRAAAVGWLGRRCATQPGFCSRPIVLHSS